MYFLVRGGLNEVYRCQWYKTLDGDVLHDLDMISAYPFSAMGLLPVGNYEVHIQLIIYVGVGGGTGGETTAPKVQKRLSCPSGPLFS